MSGRTDTERLDWMRECVSSISQKRSEDSLWKLMFFSPISPASFSEVTPDEFREAIDAAMDAEEVPHAPDPRRERLARAMTTHSSRPWEGMNENTRKLHLAEADRLLAAIDGREQG